jgi:hypothetical protein
MKNMLIIIVCAAAGTGAFATGWGAAVQIGRSRKRSTGGRDVRS